MQRRTRKSYEALYDNPAFLFGSAEVVLFPNGQPEIQVKSRDGKRGYRITASDSLSGLSIEVIPLPTTDTFSIFPSVETTNIHTESGLPVVDQSPRVSLLQYREDSRPVRLTRRTSKSKKTDSPKEESLPKTEVSTVA